MAEVMQHFIGTKEINAQPMTLGEYNDLRGWDTPENEDPETEGYLVEYLDGGEPNHEDFKGYISWSPKAVFEKSYRRTDGMTFGLALEAMRRGQTVTRKSWPASTMALYLQDGQIFGAMVRFADMLADDWKIV